MVSIILQISDSSCPLSKPLGTIQSAPTTIGITITLLLSLFSFYDRNNKWDSCNFEYHFKLNLKAVETARRIREVEEKIPGRYHLK